jgi:membrane fusion protein, multidrug efflux system
MRLTSGPILCACVTCLCIAGCRKEEAPPPPVVRPARVAVVAPNKLELVAQGAGRIEARYVSQVGFEVGGRLISRDVDVGAVVSKGKRLAALSAADFRNKVTAAEADVATAKAALVQVSAQEERDRVLADKGYTPRAVHDESLKALRSAEAAVQSSEANLEIARNQLDHTELEAPSDGVVTATGADPGQVVEAGQMVLEISRDAEREAVFAVAGEDVARAAVGMPVKVWLQAQPGVAVTGSIREISPVADSATGTYRVKVALPSAPQEMRLGAIVVGRAEAEGQEVTTLPATALLQSGDGPEVWVVAPDNRVQRRAVELLEFNSDSVVVGPGLSPGEQVVTAGVNSLADGQEVKPETEIE